MDIFEDNSTYVTPIIAVLAAWQLDARANQDALERRRQKIMSHHRRKRHKRRKARRVIESLIEKEIPYDEWLKNAAHGKYDSWLKRSAGAWQGDLTVALFADNLPDDGFYASGPTLESCVAKLSKMVPAYQKSTTTLNNEIVLNNAILFVAESGTNRLFSVYSRTPTRILKHGQLESLISLFDVNSYEDVQWANAVGRPQTSVATANFLGAGKTKKTREKRL